MEETIQPLSRIFLEIGPITIYWYGAIIATGIILGYILAVKETVKRGLPKDTFGDLLIWAIPISIISARLYYVIFRFDHYIDDPIRILYIWEGGLAIHGGLIGGVITAIIFARKRKIPILKLLDIGAPSVLLAQGIGRWGNFMNHEVYGNPVSREFLESLLLPSFIIDQMYINGVYYHPTFLYESLWSFIGVFILLYLRRVNLKNGEIFYSYVIWYSIGRFIIEGMRLDNLMIGDAIRTAQLVSIVLIIGGIFIWIYRRKTGLANSRYLDIHTNKRKNNKNR